MDLEKTGINPYPSNGGIDPNSARQFRREVEQEYRAEIRQLREESRQKDLEIHRLDSEVQKLRAEMESDREKNAPALAAAKTWAEASNVGQKIIVTLTSIIVLIGLLISAYESVRQWVSNHH